MEKEPGPRSDVVFDRKVVKLDEFFADVAVARGYDAAFVNDRFHPMVVKWKKAYAEYLDKDKRTRVVTNLKNGLRKELEKLYSEGVRMVKANAMTSDIERIDLEIAPNVWPHHDPLSPMTTSPDATRDLREVGRVTTQFREKGEKSTAMPHHAGSLQIQRVKSGIAPASEEEWATGVIITVYSTLYLQDYPTEDQGIMVCERYRWMSPTGKPGPWSKPEIFRVP